MFVFFRTLNQSMGLLGVIADTNGLQVGVFELRPSRSDTDIYLILRVQDSVEFQTIGFRIGFIGSTRIDTHCLVSRIVFI